VGGVIGKPGMRRQAFSGRLLLPSHGSEAIRKHNRNRGIRLGIVGLRFVRRWQGFTAAVFDLRTTLIFLMKLAAGAGKT
jgi:hypothetical protein